MKNKVKVILFLIITLFLFSFATNEVFASENINYEPKIYCELNVEDDFSLDSVLVMIDKNLSDVNKVFEKSFFGNLDIINIEDLTYRENWNNNVDIKEENFRQTLELHLESQTKDSIISIIKNLEKIDGIVCASPNYIGTNGLVTISDPNYHIQWGLSNTNGINAEQAWDFVIGSREVRVGILDTGITPHVDLNDNLISGFSYIDDNTNVDDDHGSHVAGIVGAVGNTLGISGVARKISLVPMKFNGDIGDVQSALTDAETNNIRIVNMSWWDFPNNPILRNAINTFDGLFVCIAGNGDTDIETKPNYPASFNLDNMIVVGAIKSDSSRPTVSDWGYDEEGMPIGSNYGSNTVDLFAPGDNIYSTVPTNSYASMGGTSMAAPHVAGVAALLLSINPNLTTQQLRTAILESVDIPNVNGSNPLEDLCVTDGRLNAYNAVRYVLENYMNPTTYTLSNYSSTINTNKTIASDASYFDELNGFYKLNVTYAKSYEFISSSTSGIEVTLYDEDFTEIPFNDLDSTSNKVHFIENLSTGTYYLRTKYASEDSTGTINTKIVSRNTTYLNAGKNDILINSYNNISSYVYGNSTGKGFYKITLSANTSSGVITYPESCIKIYKDFTKQELVTRLETIYYTLPANTSSSSNNLIVFLDQGSTYYIDIIIPNDIYSIVSLDIEKIEDTYEINMFNNIEGVYEEEVLLENDETQFGDYIQKIEIKQKGIYGISFIHDGPQSEASSNFLYYALYKELVGQPEEVGNVEMLLPHMTTTMGGTITYEFILDKGVYYIGYYNKFSYEPMSITIKYQIDIYDSNKIITDPDLLTDCGSMINIYEKNFSNKSYRGKTIVVGFTRILYLDPILEIDTRTDYSWYSSNEDIATVSEFGTVFAKSPGTVKIMAVNKEDLKIVYIETFTIINDNSTDSTERIININDTHSVSDGDYLVGLTVLNSPYPSAYLYDWEILSYDETITRIEYIGSGYFVIEGFGDVFIKGSNYAYNNKYSIKIYLNVTQ